MSFWKGIIYLMFSLALIIIFVIAGFNSGFEKGYVVGLNNIHYQTFNANPEACLALDGFYYYNSGYEYVCYGFESECYKNRQILTEEVSRDKSNFVFNPDEKEFYRVYHNGLEKIHKNIYIKTT